MAQVDAATCDGSGALTRDNEADEVERVRSGDDGDVVGVSIPVQAETFDGFGQGVLFSGKAGDESPAAHIAAGFKPTEHAKEIAPLGGVALALNEIAALKQDFCRGFERGFGDARFLRGGQTRGVFAVEEGPASACRARAAFGAIGNGLSGERLAFWIHHDAKLVEAVCGDKACGRKFPQGGLYLWFGQGAKPLQIGGKACAALLQDFARGERFRRESLLQFRCFDTFRIEHGCEPVGGFAHVEGDGCHVGGDHTTGCGTITSSPCGMRAEAAPPDSTTEAKRIQKAGLVVADALRQQAALPLDGGSFKAFKLEKGVEGAFFAGKLRAFRKMLPVQQPAHVGGGRDGFYLFAEIAE